MKTDSETNDAYRAIGRWFVEFSRLIFHMRHAIERQLAGEGDITIPMLALGEAEANRITDSFFSICSYLADLEDGEIDVAARLKKEVREETKRRNDFAHGDWWIGPNPADEGHEIDEPLLWRTKPGKREFLPAMKSVPIADLDSLSDGLCQLRQYVAEFGDLCMGSWPFADKFDDEVRVRHVFRIDKKTKRLVRDGPAAIGGITYH